MGQVTSISGAFVAWDEDLLDFICKLSSASGLSSMRNLSRDLSDQNVSLLALGLNFSDWLLRLFLRVAWQQRVEQKELSPTYVAEAVTHVSQDNLVMMWECRSNSVEVLEIEPREFVRELAERWKRRHPDHEQLAATAKLIMPGEMPTGAIFISYVREDEAAVKNIVARLQAQGCDVWLDLERLKSGMNFDSRIEDYVKQKCALFVSVISLQTEAENEAYFHKERNWAVERADRFSDADRFFSITRSSSARLSSAA